MTGSRLRPPTRLHGFTLVEIMIVVGILGVILAIAAPTWMRQREITRQRSCQENLAKIEGAKEQWAMEYRMSDLATPGWDNLVSDNGTGYLKVQPHCPGAGVYEIGTVSQRATCSITEPMDHNADH